MARQDIERFMNTARVRLPGATEDALQLEMFQMLDEFFKDTNVWMEDIDMAIPGNDIPGTIYYVVPSTPSVIDRLMWVFGVPADNKTLRGEPVGAVMQVPGELVLGFQPSSTVTYRVTVALSVQDPTQKDGYVSFPAWILAKYRLILLDGLLGRMMSQPNKPFTNAQMSVFHMRKFSTGKAQVRVEVARSNTFRRQAWAYPAFARGSQRGFSHGTGSFSRPQ